MYVTQGRYNEAESAALAAHQGYLKRLGENHQDTRTVAEQLAALYDATGSPEKAAQWRERLAQAREVRR